MEFTIRHNHDDHWNMPQSHLHDRLELLLSLSDGGSFFVQDNRHPLHRGTLILMQDQVLHHSIATDGAYERYVVHIPRQTLLEVSTDQTDFSALLQTNVCIQLEEAAFRQVCSLMEQCLAQPKAVGDDVLRNCAFLSLLVQVGRLLKQPMAYPLPPDGLSAPVRCALDWINAHLTEQLPLDALAEHCFVTKYHLCRRFKEETGFTVGQYMLRLRLLRAAALLRTGETVQRAAEAAGFHNYNNFIRAFGRLMGQSPGRYQRQFRQR